MSNTQEFIYKGYNEGQSYEHSFYRLSIQGDNTPYYMLKLDNELEVGQKLQVSYNHMAPYKQGQLLVGGTHHE